MFWKKRLMVCFTMVFAVFPAIAQRVYKPNSVLAQGDWYKLSISKPGVYKIDIPFLNALGINTSSLSSASVRLYGNSGFMLSEPNAISRIDDLEENSLFAVDGGDGVLNGQDHLLFYASGPQQWQKDSANSRFSHKKNLYSDSSFYFLTIGANGKRVSSKPNGSNPSVFITSYNSRYSYELDSFNMLSSGKEWFGEEFTNSPGKALSANFQIPAGLFSAGQPVTLISNCMARSINENSSFEVKENNNLIQQITIPSTTAGAYDLFAKQQQLVSQFSPSSQNLSITYTYIPGSFNSQGWLNWFELHGRSNLAFNSNEQLFFRDWGSAGNTQGEFRIGNANTFSKVWDVTDPLNPVNIEGALSNNDFVFVNSCLNLKEYIAFNTGSYYVPTALGRIAAQNLHNAKPAAYIIISHPLFLPQAERLAAFHLKKNNMSVAVVTTDQVYNEFSSGSHDPVAIRDFIKMYYDKFSTGTDKLKYVLLFGDASFDYKKRIPDNTNFVPAYESASSLDPLTTYTSDDFFGFLDDNEDINSGFITNLLDIGIGRVPAKNITEAKNYIDKVEAYYSKESFGPWRNNLTFIADDEDQNLHLQDAESITNAVSTVNKLFNNQKIYLDAYAQQSTSTGEAYPDANEAINNKILNGTLIFNYSGHGGSRRLAEEVVVDQGIIDGWKNENHLPLFITATCDFAPYDIPYINSLGENLLLRPKTGAIALMTTTRLVFAFSNRIMNTNYLNTALLPDANGNYKSLGEAVQAAKNFTYQNSADITNNRKFTLLGDPALTLSFTKGKIKLSSVNSLPFAQTDTLSPGQKVLFEGEVTDNAGLLLNTFNGTAYTTVFDKPQTISTKGNDATSPVTNFTALQNVIYKGKSTVTNGKFKVEFKIPRDLGSQFGNGKLSFYADNGSTDAGSYNEDIVFGGNGITGDNDKEGPEIKAWLNDEKFVNGSVSNSKPILILKFSDSSGINTLGTGIGHDITATIDNDNNRFFVLNEYYEADADHFTKGSLKFQLPGFEPGHHTLTIKAWDVVNNSGEKTLDFTVADDGNLVINHVLNYPNPFTTHTSFWFEHNKPGEDLNLHIQIFTITGRVIKTINKTINTPGNRSSETSWDGRDEFGQKVGRGVYLYKLKVSQPGGQSKISIEKLVIL